MGSYTQHLPKLGSIANLEAPFFFPSTTHSSDFIYFRRGNSMISLNSNSDRGDFVVTARRKQAVATRSTGTKTVYGRGVLTHLITPYSQGTSTYTFRVVVDGKSTYKLTISVPAQNLGVFGGFLIGNATVSQYTQGGAGLGTSDFNEGTEKILLSPLDTAQQGIGIPFESSISITKVSGTGESIPDYISVIYKDEGTITKES